MDKGTTSGTILRARKILGCRWLLRSHHKPWVILVLLTCLLPATYHLENWRGASAWQACKKKAAEKGIPLSSQMPRPTSIPDHLNVFKTPVIAAWFGDDRLNTWRLMQDEVLFGGSDGAHVLAEVTVLPLETEGTPKDCDLSLHYRPHLVTIASAEPPPLNTIPLIVMDEVPLLDAIRNLARQAGLNYLLHPSVMSHWSTPKGVMASPLVSVRWDNISAMEALALMLYNHHLEMTEDPQTGIARVVWRRDTTPKPHLPLSAKEQLLNLLSTRFLDYPTNKNVQKLCAAGDNFVLFSGTKKCLPQVSPKPRHISIRSKTGLISRQVEEMVRIAVSGSKLENRVRATLCGAGRFRIYAGPPSGFPAENYLALTRIWEEDFDLMREALKRPNCYLEGDHQLLSQMPGPCLRTLRVVAETLARRAQSYLLSNRAEDALRELVLVLDLTRLVQNEASATHRPVFRAMTRNSMLDLCATVVGEGLELGLWTELQMRELQGRLAEHRLAAEQAGAILLERAASCALLEGMTAESFQICSRPAGQSRWLPVMESAGFWILALAPRGWVHQNLVNLADYWQCMSAVYDSKQDRLTCPTSAISKKRVLFKPYIALAECFTFDLNLAWQRTARTQAKIDHAVIACALELYRDAKGGYPKSLHQLVPGYLPRLPCDILTGRPHHYNRVSRDQFLLYSVGWNRLDEGGRGRPSTESSYPSETADWVWP